MNINLKLKDQPEGLEDQLKKLEIVDSLPEDVKL